MLRLASRAPRLRATVTSTLCVAAGPVRPDPLKTAASVLQERYPNCLGAFVGGSIFRGEETDTSDIDVVVLYDNSFDDVHRASVVVDGWPIEFFVQSIQAQDHFLEKDRLRGMCVMPDLIASSRAVPTLSPEMIEQRRKAEQIIANGPPTLTTVDIDRRRYAITDLLDDLVGADKVAVKNAVLARLHDKLGDFYLRAGGRWSGEGKALLRCLKAADKSYAERFEDAFEAAFAGIESGVTGVVSLADETLAQHGGRLWAGYEERADPEWQESSR